MVGSFDSGRSSDEDDVKRKVRKRTKGTTRADRRKCEETPRRMLEKKISEMSRRTLK